MLCVLPRCKIYIYKVRDIPQQDSGQSGCEDLATADLESSSFFTGIELY